MTNDTAPDSADNPADNTPPDDSTKTSREAAKYRRQARDAEAERDALAAQLTSAREQLLQQTLSNGIDTPSGARRSLLSPSDLTSIGGIDSAELWAEDGKLDIERVGQALDELHAQRPELFASARLVVRDEGGVRSGLSGPVGGNIDEIFKKAIDGKTLQDAFTPPGR